jgi:hypothetical protein
MPFLHSMTNGAARTNTSKVLIVNAREVKTERRLAERLPAEGISPPSRSPVVDGDGAYSFGDVISLY